jgi:hypothetical protein
VEASAADIGGTLSVAKDVSSGKDVETSGIKRANLSRFMAGTWRHPVRGNTYGNLCTCIQKDRRWIEVNSS